MANLKIVPRQDLNVALNDQFRPIYTFEEIVKILSQNIAATGIGVYADDGTSVINLAVPLSLYQLDNNGGGAGTVSTYKDPATQDVWETSTGTFGFGGSLNVGDSVDWSIKVDFTTAASNSVSVRLRTAAGSPDEESVIYGPFSIPAGTTTIPLSGSILLKNQNTADAPSIFLASATGVCTALLKEVTARTSRKI